MAKSVDINAALTTAAETEPGAFRLQRTRGTMISVVALWAVLVLLAAATGLLAQLYQPLIGAIVAATILLPTLWYFLSRDVRAVIESIGHRRIVQFHVWRVPAALLFFWYGAQGFLPPLFWVLAGVGDLIAGLYALRLSLRPESAAQYQMFHRFGFADFVVAVGTGLTFTLLLDPRMAPIAQLPMALIPLLGVGISGASHLIAFDMLRRRVGFARALEPERIAALHIASGADR